MDGVFNSVIYVKKMPIQNKRNIEIHIGAKSELTNFRDVPTKKSSGSHLHLNMMSKKLELQAKTVIFQMQSTHCR